MLISVKKVIAPLFSAHTPLNMMGRDILYLLKANIVCAQDGVHVSFHDVDSTLIQYADDLLICSPSECEKDSLAGTRGA